VVKIGWSTWQYKKKVRRFDAVLRRILCELAAKHVRYGYRRLTVLLRREGWKVNAKRIYRLYTEEQLIVRTKLRRKLARRERGGIAMATAPNQCWSMDFMSDKLADGRSFRILTVGGPVHAGVRLPGSGPRNDGDAGGTGAGASEGGKRKVASKHYRGQWN